MIISCAIILFIDVCDIEQESGFEWRESVVLDKPGFGLSTINKYFLITCNNKHIVCRKFTN